MQGADFDVVVWGDSYAASLAAGLTSSGVKTINLTTGGCGLAPIDSSRGKNRKLCEKRNLSIIDYIQSINGKYIIMFNKWTAVRNSMREIDSLIMKLKENSPDLRMVLVGPTPEWYPSLPLQILRSGIGLDSEERLPLRRYDELQEIDQFVEHIAAKHDVKFFSYLKTFCQDALCPVVVASDGAYHPVMHDYGHFTAFGGAQFAQKLIEKYGVQ